MDAELKLRAIYLFNKWLNRAEKGYIDDYSNILNIISYIELYPKIDNEAVFQFLMNN